jgi:hypothetical protein
LTVPDAENFDLRSMSGFDADSDDVTQAYRYDVRELASIEIDQIFRKSPLQSDPLLKSRPPVHRVICRRRCASSQRLATGESGPTPHGRISALVGTKLT